MQARRNFCAWSPSWPITEWLHCRNKSGHWYRGDTEVGPGMKDEAHVSRRRSSIPYQLAKACHCISVWPPINWKPESSHSLSTPNAHLPPCAHLVDDFQASTSGTTPSVAIALPGSAKVKRRRG